MTISEPSPMTELEPAAPASMALKTRRSCFPALASAPRWAKIRENRTGCSRVIGAGLPPSPEVGVRRRTKHGETAGPRFDRDGLVSPRTAKCYVYVRGQSLVTRRTSWQTCWAMYQRCSGTRGRGWAGSGSLPANSRNCAHDGRKSVGEPLVRSLLRGHVLHIVWHATHQCHRGSRRAWCSPTSMPVRRMNLQL